MHNRNAQTNEPMKTVPRCLRSLESEFGWCWGMTPEKQFLELLGWV